MRKAIFLGSVFCSALSFFLFTRPFFAYSSEEAVAKTSTTQTPKDSESLYQSKPLKEVPPRETHSPERNWPSKMRLFAGGATHGRGIFYIDYLLPLYYSEDQNTLLFFNPKQNFSSPYSEELNLGLGLRQIINDKFILGIHSFFDRSYSTNEVWHKQLGYGLEFLSEPLDFRFNYYDPNTKPQILNSSYELGSTHLLDVYEKEEALRGFEFEFGGPIFERFTKTRGYLGGFFYGSKLAKDVNGFKARTETNLSSWFSLDTVIKSLAKGKTEFIAGLRFTIPLEWGRLFAKQSPIHNTPSASYIKDRLFERVVRDIDIQSNAATQKQNDPNVEIIYVNNTSSGTSDGSLEHPYTTLAGALASSRYGTGKYVYVFKGDGSAYTGGITLQNNVTLWGSGYNGGYNDIPVPGYPVINGGGAYSVITLAANNTIMGCQLQNAFYGIYGENVSTVNINHNIIGSSTFGISLESSGSSTISATISSNTMSGNGGEGIILVNLNSSTISATISGNTISNYDTGLDLENFDSSAISASIFRNTISSNIDGIELYDMSSGVLVADIGGGILGSIGYNSIYSNTTIYDIYNYSAPTVKAQHNWWGQVTPDPTKFYGDVDYSLPLTSNPN
jgi:hypothetical protein